MGIQGWWRGGKCDQTDHRGGHKVKKEIRLTLTESLLLALPCLAPPLPAPRKWLGVVLLFGRWCVLGRGKPKGGRTYDTWQGKEMACFCFVFLAFWGVGGGGGGGFCSFFSEGRYLWRLLVKAKSGRMRAPEIGKESHAMKRTSSRRHISGACGCVHARVHGMGRPACANAGQEGTDRGPPPRPFPFPFPPRFEGGERRPLSLLTIIVYTKHAFVQRMEATVGEGDMPAEEWMAKKGRNPTYRHWSNWKT